MPSSLPGEKCVPSSIVFWFLDKYTYMIVNSERIHGPSQFMNHYLNREARGKGCFVLFLPSQRQIYGKTDVHILYNHITNDKTEAF